MVMCIIFLERNLPELLENNFQVDLSEEGKGRFISYDYSAFLIWGHIKSLVYKIPVNA